MVPLEESIAIEFHNTYERLAPEFGHETRQESAVEWKDIAENHRNLMIATVTDLLRRGVIPMPFGDTYVK